MLLDRSDLIQPVVVQMWKEPENASLRHVLLRLLNYYDELMGQRRVVDRQAKQPHASDGLLNPVHPESTVGDGEEKQSLANFIPLASNDSAVKNLQHVVEKLKLVCNREGCKQSPSIIGFQAIGKTVVLELQCAVHGELPVRKLTTEELAASNPFE